MSLSDIVLIKTYTARQNIYPIKKPCRLHHAFIYTVSGTENYETDGRTIRANPGTLLYLPKGSAYRVTLDGEESTVICMDFELANDAGAHPFLFTFRNPDVVHSYFTEAKNRWENADDYIPYCKSAFYRITAAMVAQSSLYVDGNRVGILRESVDYLRYHFAESTFRIEKLYEIAAISPKYYTTLFSKQFGMTPKEYLIFLKIERAKNLLSAEKLSVKDIAFEVGYSDIYYFSRIFKQKTGFSPSAYRKIISTPTL